MVSVWLCVGYVMYLLCCADADGSEEDDANLLG